MPWIAILAAAAGVVALVLGSLRIDKGGARDELLAEVREGALADVAEDVEEFAADTLDPVGEACAAAEVRSVHQLGPWLEAGAAGPWARHRSHDGSLLLVRASAPNEGGSPLLITIDPNDTGALQGAGSNARWLGCWAAGLGAAAKDSSVLFPGYGLDGYGWVVPAGQRVSWVRWHVDAAPSVAWTLDVVRLQAEANVVTGGGLWKALAAAADQRAGVAAVSAAEADALAATPGSVQLLTVRAYEGAAQAGGITGGTAASPGAVSLELWGGAT